MRLVERHYLKGNQEEANDLCFKSKNIYNQGNYKIRQHYFETRKYLKYKELDKLMQQEECYKALPRKVSQQTLKVLDKNWKSFFNALKEFKKNPEKFKVPPSIPKYLDKQKGRFVAIYTNQAINKGSKLSQTNIKFNTKEEIKQVRIIPKRFGYILEVIYERKEKKQRVGKRFASIDLGLNNLATITTDFSEPILINGRTAKSFNQYYNKYPTKRNLKKRYFRIENYFHHSSKFIIDFCKANKVSKIIIGYNEGWKESVNHWRKDNKQNFKYLPLLNLVEKIKYKAELEGIEVILVEESYTSKASFLDKDPLDGSQLSGKRFKRGLYKTKNGFKINADVNGSLNIGRKVIREWVVDRSLVARPVKVNPLHTSYFSIN